MPRRSLLLPFSLAFGTRGNNDRQIMAMSSEYTYAPHHAAYLEDTQLKESLEETHHMLTTRLATELLQRVRQAPPAFFEHLVIDLLLAMGYGYGHGNGHSKFHPGPARVTKLTGDGGIDGIIHQDPLGLDTIYIQAKRWEHPVGEPQLRDFIGALHVRRARKGVFITTSAFTPAARRYIELADYNISLIDGPRLAGLMIDHGIGVTLTHAYTLKEIPTPTTSKMPTYSNPQ